MQVAFDCEADGLDNPTKLWCIVAKDLSTGDTQEFLNVHDNPGPFLGYAKAVTLWVSHNALGYDQPHINRILGQEVIPQNAVVDTLVISQLVNYPREEGHSLESYGPEARVPKEGTEINDWQVYSPLMLARCRSDVDITEFVYKKYYKYIASPLWASAIATEQALVPFCNELKNNGFFFNREEATALKGRIDHEIAGLDKELARVFPPRSVLIKEITPKITKHGTLHRGALKWAGSDLTAFSAGATFSRIRFETFNPGSTKQRIDRLWEAGWKPTEKTKGYKEFLRSLPRGRQKKSISKEQEEKLEHFKKYGFKTDEKNLSTLPLEAPPAFKTLVRWLLLKPRSRRIDEWLGCCGVDSRIHGTFRGLGAWSGRMAHSAPNMGNVPAFNPDDPEKTPYSDEMRRLWQAAPGKFLAGTDAEGIQLRVLAHYLEDDEFTFAVTSGNKKDGTDPHTLNQRAIGEFCRSRDDAKTFIYAWLLGAGLGKIAEILKCSAAEAALANDNFISRYDRLKWLKEKQIPKDAFNRWFLGFDGRAVSIPGDSIGERKHLALAGYLQNGETIVVKRAFISARDEIRRLSLPAIPVNVIHDEIIYECDDEDTAKKVIEIQSAAITQAGVDLKLKCPMRGLGKIGRNWMETH